MKRRILIWGGLFVAMALVVIVMVWISGGSENTKPAEASSLDNNQAEILEVRENEWTKGNKDAKVVIVKYSDFKCPACRYYASFDDVLSKELGDEVLFVFRNFPLSNSEVPMLAARYAEAAGRQDKFWKMHDLIYINQQVWANNNPESAFQQFVKLLKLDDNQFYKDLEDPAISEKIKADYEGGLKVGVRAVPTIFINGKKIRNPGSIQAYRQLIKSHLE